MTRKKTVEQNISAEYTTLKHAIMRQKDTLEKALPYVKKSAHTAFAESYRMFAELVINDMPVDSSAYDSIKDANDAAKKIHTEANTPEGSESTTARLVAHVESYINELKMIIKEFPTVEKSFVETDRYERKVGKLSEKTAKAAGIENGKSDGNKMADKTRRNMDKLESERAAFNTKLDSVIDMMKKTNAKYEKVLQCTHTAFWLSEDKFVSFLAEATASVREQCKQDEQAMVDLDVSKL